MPQIRPATVGAVVLAFVVAALVVRVAHSLIHRALNALDIVGAENRAAVHARAQQLKHALTLLAYGVAALAVISMALDRFGVKEPQWDPRLLGHWLFTHGVNLALIAASAFTSCARPASSTCGSASWRQGGADLGGRAPPRSADPDERRHRLGRSSRS
jgi:hypothetical protein